MEEEEDAASEGEADGDARVAPKVGEQTDKHDDTTESSDGGADADDDGDGDDHDARAAASPVPAAGSNSESATYRNSELERNAPPPVSSSRGKSSEPGVVEQVGVCARVVVDLSSGSEPNSEGSSSVPVSKPAPSSRRTKELEAAARKAQAVPSKQVLKERWSKTSSDVDAGKASVSREAHS